MKRFTAAHDCCHWACRICTIVVLLCLLMSSVVAGPVLTRIVAPGSQTLPEEETHAHFRLTCPRQARFGFTPDTTVAPLHDRLALEGFRHCRQLPPSLVLPCLVGSGIRLRC